VISAVFLLTYGLLRIATEFSRLPDPQFVHERIDGLSRGQWLSVIMVGAGLALTIWTARRRVPKVGGWATRGDKVAPAPPEAAATEKPTSPESGSHKEGSA